MTEHNKKMMDGLKRKARWWEGVGVDVEWSLLCGDAYLKNSFGQSCLLGELF